MTWVANDIERDDVWELRLVWRWYYFFWVKDRRDPSDIMKQVHSRVKERKAAYDIENRAFRHTPPFQLNDEHFWPMYNFERLNGY